MTADAIPLARQGVFHTVQGEGVLFGEPSVCVRLAGCSVNCDGCDTDYAMAERVDHSELGRRIASACQPATRWLWVTGGEPTIHYLQPVYAAGRKAGLRIALATAGVNRLPNLGFCASGPDFVSVSPHKIDESWVLRRGDQLNVVPGLNGLRLADMDNIDVSGFMHRFVTPFWYGPGERVEKAAECAEWVATHPGWRLGIQAHKTWGVA